MFTSHERKAGQDHKFKYLGKPPRNHNWIQITSRLKSGNACYHLVWNLLSSRLWSKNIKAKVHRTIILPVVLYRCETWPPTWAKCVSK
jgi:hypothetical protein